MVELEIKAEHTVNMKYNLLATLEYTFPVDNLQKYKRA